MPIFWPVAAFIITLLLAEGGLLPAQLKKECDKLTTKWLSNAWFFIHHDISVYSKL
jgi:hypothetical protein